MSQITDFVVTIREGIMRSIYFLRNIAVVAAVLAIASVSTAVGQGRVMGGIGITIFDERDYRGKSAKYTREVANLDGTGFNDRISSLRIAPGEVWEICEDANYAGRCVVVSGDEPDLGRNSWNNTISSFRRAGGSSGAGGREHIVLFDQLNYGGRPTNIYGPAPYLDGTARSIRVSGGYWELCNRENYRGLCSNVETSVANLGNLGLGTRILSARPVRGSSPAPLPDRNWYVVLYSQQNYRGTPSNYSGAQPRINITAGSITIGEGVWEVCTGSNFTGNCQTIRRSQSNMNFLGSSRTTVRSLRPVRRQPR